MKVESTDEKHIAKIMLCLAMLSLVAAPLHVFSAIGAPAFFREAQQLKIAGCANHRQHCAI